MRDTAYVGGGVETSSPTLHNTHVSVAGSRKGGRKSDTSRQYFVVNGDKGVKQKRYPMKCTLCNTGLAACKATAAGLRAHLLNCEQATQDIKTQITQAAAEKINQQAAAAAAATAAAGSSVSRKRSSSTGSTSQPNKQMRIHHYAAGSTPNDLLPAQRLAAHQHLLRALVCGGIPFKVGHCSLHGGVCMAAS